MKRKLRKEIDDLSFYRLVGLSQRRPEVTQLLRDQMADPELKFDPERLYRQESKNADFLEKLKAAKSHKEIKHGDVDPEDAPPESGGHQV